MRFKNLDLNLIVLLSSLLATRSVSESGRRLNLSQPAISAGLSRLRDYFGDPLFVTYGRRMSPTAFVESLAPLVARAMADVDALVSASNAFDPATSERLFRIGASDFISLVAVAPLLRRLKRVAPNVQVHTVAPSELMLRALDLGELDLIITPDEFLSSDHPAQLLFEESHVVVGWDQNPIFEQGVTEDAFFASGQVVVEIGKERRSSFAERHVARFGRERRIDVTTSSFAVVPWLLPGTERLAVMHERLARQSVRVLPLRIAPLPFEFPAMRQMVQLHPSKVSDPGIAWFLGQLRETLSQDDSGELEDLFGRATPAAA
jgi:DNA-binding transcriptional LysR family regulator